MATITGTADADQLNGTADVDTILGLEGNDTITAGLGDSVDGGSGTDALTLDLRAASAGVSINKDYMTGTGISLFGGRISNVETIAALYLPNFYNFFSALNPLSPYSVTVYGGTDVDHLTGSNLNDSLHGGAGDDQLDGRSGDDYLYGEEGNDLLAGGAGRDTIDGGAGNDTVHYALGPDGIEVDLASGSATDGAGAYTHTLISIENAFGTDSRDTLRGDSGSNNLSGFAGDDLIEGRDGDDYLYGDGGADTLLGGAGNDVLQSGEAFFLSFIAAHDVLDGGAGDDILYFGHGDDVIGGDGFDVGMLSLGRLQTAGVTINVAALLAGTAGANGGGSVSGVEAIGSIYGTEYADTIDLGGATLSHPSVGLPMILSGAGDDTLIGGPGDDWFLGGEGADRIYGGAGDDRYYVDDTDDLIFELANEGRDIVTSTVSLYLQANIEWLSLETAIGDLYGVGNAGDNHISGNKGANLLLGGAGNDQIFGDDGNDNIFGEDGADALSGGYGIDYIVGGAGNDGLSGNEDSDALYGEDGDDQLGGGSDFATDILVGGAGNDVLYANSGLNDYDLLDGGSGNDLYFVDTGDDLTFEAVGGGYDVVYADISNVPNAGVYLYANVEELILQGTTAFGVGNELANRMTGSASSNWLLGGAGNDVLIGKGGNDVLFGEAGQDTFVFERGSGGDVIGDFQHGTDRIHISAFGFGSFAVLQANFIQNGDVGAINLGGGDFIVLHGVTMTQLTADDFVL